MPLSEPIARKKKPSAWAAILQRRVNAWVKGGTDRDLEPLLGYSREQLIMHLQRQFKRGMSWDNYAGNNAFKAKGTWVIDHIVAKSKFSHSEANVAFALSNLRPLCINKNIRKNIQRTHLI